MRAAVLLPALLVCASCGKQPLDRKEEPPPVVVPVTPPPPPPPVMPPEMPFVSASATPSASAVAQPPKTTNFERASQAALNGRFAEVRSLLLPAARSGRATPDERRLLRQACRQLHDDACLADVPALP